MKSKTLYFSIVLGVVLVFGAIMLTKPGPSPTKDLSDGNNVTMVDGKQIIEISAKGGYTPSITTAVSGVPTILRFKTSGTFDCSSSVRIPSMNITKFLPNSGSTDIDLGTQKSGTLQGSCGMGMYPFQVVFK